MVSQQILDASPPSLPASAGNNDHGCQSTFEPSRWQVGSRRSVWRLAFGVRGDLPVRRSPTSCRVVGLLSWDEVGSLYAERSTLRKTLSGATDVPNQETQSPSVIRHLSFVMVLASPGTRNTRLFEQTQISAGGCNVSPPPPPPREKSRRTILLSTQPRPRT